MTGWLDPSLLPERLGDAAGPLAGLAAIVVIMVRDRRRRRPARLVAMRPPWLPDACDPITTGEGDTVRMTLLAEVDQPGDLEAAQDWLRAHRGSLAYLSAEDGCGCCVVSWDLEGPREVVQTLPNRLRCNSGWTRGERGQGPRCEAT